MCMTKNSLFSKRVLHFFPMDVFKTKSKMAVMWPPSSILEDEKEEEEEGSEVPSFDLRFPPCMRLILSGPSGCGKTSFLASFFRNAHLLMKEAPRRICYFFQLRQPAFEEMQKELGSLIRFYEGMPSRESLEAIVEAAERPLILAFDDLSLQISSHIVDLFQVWSHHRQCAVILILQNFFGQKIYRECSLSATHLVLFKSPRDKQTAMNLGKQIFPGRAGEFMRLYEDATAKPHSYLMICLEQKTNDNLRLLSSLLPEERPICCWILE